jgi:hypothetical protein
MSYSGGLSDNNVIDMYDAARGLAGFNRSLALTTHLVLHGEIITQAPSLRDAQIISSTPEQGSWKVTAVILAGIWTVATAPKDTVAGALLFSAYDYVIKESLGFNPTFDKSLGVQYEEYLKSKKITQEKMDSLIEKTEASIGDIHRPIVASKTAMRADLVGFGGRDAPQSIGPQLTQLTYQYLAHTVREKDDVILIGSVSSFNINTYKGRLFSYDEQRPIPFELSDRARNTETLIVLTRSLSANAANRGQRAGPVRLVAQRLVSSTGRLKSLIVHGVSTETQVNSEAYQDILG